MTSITPTSSTLGAVKAPSSGERSDSIASDLDQFLTLLTAQLENQDPLDPMDTHQFTDQLTQLSQLEQATAQTDELETLNNAVAGLTARVDSLFLGRTIETSTDTIALQNGEARISVAAAENTTAQLEILSSNGRVVAQLQSIGENGVARFDWDGRDLNGVKLADGAYTVRATTGEGEIAQDAEVLLSGVIEELRYTTNGGYLRLNTGEWAPLEQLRAVGGGA